MRGTWASCSRRLRWDGCPDPSRPSRGQDLVGPPAEQERVGALVGLVDERKGLVVEDPHGPSTALESLPAVLIRRAAVSLHHSIDGDLRHGRQLHVFVLSLVVVFLGMTAPRRGSDRSREIPERSPSDRASISTRHPHYAKEAG